MFLQEKLLKLRSIISGYGSCLVAFSAGTDSTFLLKVASTVLDKKSLLAVTALSATYPKEELSLSKKTCRNLSVRQKIIKTRELNDKRFLANPANRCYFCKYELFSRLKRIADKEKLRFVCDGSNISDTQDFRPGDKAKKELGINSPLVEAGFSKEDIRRASRKLGLLTWNKHNLACLASRIPYGVRITADILKRIERAEGKLKKLGFNELRVRHYNGLCRIEVPRKDIPRLTLKAEQVVDGLKKLGYNYITLDLEGYRMGSMNETLRRKKQ